MPSYRAIVVGTDFSPCSAVALRRALGLSAGQRAAPSRLTVVHIIDTLVAIELKEALSSLQQDITDGLVRDARTRWAEFASAIPGAGDLPFEVAVTNRVAGIVRRADQEQADLLVLGAFGESAPDVGLGTVATACVRHATTDVLLVRDTHPGQGASPFRKVVAAVDFSETSRRVVERAAVMAAQEGAELILLHVFQAPWRRLHYRAPTPEADPAFRKQYAEGLVGRLTDFCQSTLDVVLDEGRRSGSRGLQVRHVVFDHQGHRSGIAEHAESVGADLIVLGTRGRSNLRDMLLGSTAEKALRESKCSILAVKPQELEHPMTRGT